MIVLLQSKYKRFTLVAFFMKNKNVEILENLNEKYRVLMFFNCIKNVRSKM